MTFGQSIVTCFKKYATFEGRASRSEYWWFFLFNVLVSIGTNIISGTLSSVYSLATLLPLLAVGARRLHDTNRSGWLLLLGLIPLVGWVILIVWAIEDSKEPNRFTLANPTST